MHPFRRALPLLALSLAVLVPSSAMASSARIAGLNVPGDYVKDDTGMFTYLSAVASSSNQVWIEPGAVEPAMGAVLGNLWDGRTGTWALHLRRFAPQLGQATIGDAGITSQLGFRDPNLNGEALDLMWGHRLGKGTLGLRLNRSFVSNELPAGTTEGSGNFQRNVWGIGAGYGFSFGEGRDAELSLLWQQRSFQGTNFVTPSQAKDAGSNSFLIAGRAFMRTSGTLTVVPTVKLYQFDLAAADAGGAVTDALISGWQAGVAGNWTIGSDDLFVLGAQFLNNRSEQTNPGNPQQVIVEKYYPNAFMALETRVNPWLQLRFG
ncbi:MAG: hypothetical protein K8R56_09715, partial [Candidatus Eisenbacteria bacterium]|nr:hypothetical protein [Candidatus Eisenbacteria bacterium]